VSEVSTVGFSDSPELRRGEIDAPVMNGPGMYKTRTRTQRDTRVEIIRLQKYMNANRYHLTYYFH